jgi:hypothetical protein
MHVKRGGNKRKDGSMYYYRYFDCGNYRKSGRAACSPHTVSEQVLIDLVIADIREKAAAVSTDEKRVAEQIIGLKNRESDSRMAGYEKELKAAISRLPEIEKLMMSLYEDRIKGNLPETVFATLMQKYEAQQSELNAQIPALQEKIRGNRQCVCDTAAWIRHIKEYTRLEAADEAVMLELVDRVEVGEAKKADGVTVRDIKVIYRYVGDVDGAVKMAEKEAA